MKDRFNRDINYMRISVTDRCDLNCVYCMPHGVEKKLNHESILSYEEITRIVRLSAELGIEHIRLTGGEPLVRLKIEDLVKSIKELDGIHTVTMTTNGTQFCKKAKALSDAGLDGVNFSLDTLDTSLSEKICGKPGVVDAVLNAIETAKGYGIPCKINAVLLKACESSVIPLSKLAADGIPVRFIELMPIGCGGMQEGLSPRRALGILKGEYPDLTESPKTLGNGPARYYESALLKAPIGFIDAVSHRFCESCNRVRLTSTGRLKPCLCYGDTVDLLSAMREGCDDTMLRTMIEKGIFSKPEAHKFENPGSISETHLMSEIGG